MRAGLFDMSTVNTMPNSQTPPKLPEVREPKFTAEQIDKDCPAHFQRIEAAAEAATPLQGGISVTLETRGQQIVARIEAGDKSADRASQMYLSAGLELIEAKRLAPNFKNFLRDHCNDLSRSRAYELIKIANGKLEEVRSNNRTRDRRRREKAAGVREPRTPSSSVKKPHPPKSQAQRALAEFKVAVDIWFSKMDADAKREAAAYAVAKSEAMAS
jgi:hypothetical protein